MMLSIGKRRVTKDLIEVTVEGTIETVLKKRDPEEREGVLFRFNGE